MFSGKSMAVPLHVNQEFKFCDASKEFGIETKFALLPPITLATRKGKLIGSWLDLSKIPKHFRIKNNNFDLSLDFKNRIQIN